MPAEGIGGEEAVGPHVPRGRVAKTAGVIEHGDADRLLVDGADVVDPRRGLAPGFVVGHAFGIGDAAAGLRLTSIDDATRMPNIPSLVSPKVTRAVRRSNGEFKVDRFAIRGCGRR